MSTTSLHKYISIKVAIIIDYVLGLKSITHIAIIYRLILNIDYTYEVYDGVTTINAIFYLLFRILKFKLSF